MPRRGIVPRSCYHTDSNRTRPWAARRLACVAVVLTWAGTTHTAGGGHPPQRPVVPLLAHDLPADLTPDRETTLAALQLLDDAVTVQIDGRHHRLLRALRHLEDPVLRPLFVGLADGSGGDHPSLLVHGLLGLAELDRPFGLRPETVAAIERDDIRTDLLSAALDGDLLTRATRSALLTWDGLDPAVALLLLTRRITEDGPTNDEKQLARLRDGLTHEAPGRRGLAALLLHELGDPAGTGALHRLARADDPDRLAVIGMLLDTAWTHGLPRSGDWAGRLSERDNLPPALEAQAFRVAIRFGDTAAETRWAEQFAEAPDVSRRTRLALTGLEVAPWVDADRFAPLTTDDDKLIATLGAAGDAVVHARFDPARAADAEAAVAELLSLGHPQACRWAADYARHIASPELAWAVIQQTPPGELRGRARRLDAVATATQTLLDLDPDLAERRLLDLLATDATDDTRRRAVLLGLIRSRSEASQRICAALPAFTDRPTAALAMVQRVRRPEPLTDDEAQALSRLVRGDDRLDESLRIQTAWAYLRRTGQADEAIAAVLARP